MVSWQQSRATPMPKKKVPPKRAVAKASPASLRKDAEQALLRRYVPAALVIDSDLRVAHFHGDTAPYLALAAGPPVFAVLKMVRPEFRVALRGAISKAKKEGITISSEAIRFKHNGQRGNVRLEVSPLRKTSDQSLLIVFKEVPRTARVSKAPSPS